MVVPCLVAYLLLTCVGDPNPNPSLLIGPVKEKKEKNLNGTVMTTPPQAAPAAPPAAPPDQATAVLQSMATMRGSSPAGKA